MGAICSDGVSSPNPDYPSRIRNVGDNINLFDKDTVTLEIGAISNNGDLASSTTRARTYNIEVGQKESYTISSSNKNLQVVCHFYNSSNVQTGADSEWQNLPYTFTTPTDTSILKIMYRNKNTNTIVLSEITEIKIEPGTKATSYSPYGCGSITGKISNKNFLNILANHSAGDSLTSGGLTLTFNADNTLTVNGTNTASVTFDIIGYWSDTTNYIDLDINKSYRLSINSSKYTIAPTIRDKNNGKTVYAFGTINGYAGITDFALTFGKGTYNNAIFTVQLEEGTTKTEIISHEEQLVTIPLAEGQLLHEGDVLSNKYYQKRKTLVLTGTETWTNIYGTTNKFYTNIFSSDIQGMTSIQALCSHFLYSGIQQTYDTLNSFYFNRQADKDYANGNTTFITDNITTVADFKSWLAEQYAAGTPVTVEYELATPIETELTEEQKEVLNSIHSYEGSTYIECQNVTDEIVPEITAEYYYNNEINNHYAKRIDDLEAELNEKIKLLDARLALLE